MHRRGAGLWLTTVSAGALMATTAMAQAPSDAVEEVVVTGSRLQGGGFKAPTPVTEVGAPGVVYAVTALDEVEYELSPAALVAATLNL